MMGVCPNDFYSRASYEARLPVASAASAVVTISTHAPHTRRDPRGLLLEGLLLDFYSRASYEARPV